MPCGSDPARTWQEIEDRKFAFVDKNLTKELFRKVAELEIGYWPFESYLLIVEAMANTCQKGRTDITLAFFFHWTGEMSTTHSSHVIFASCVDYSIEVINRLDKQRLFDELKTSTAFYFLISVLKLIAKASVIENQKQLEKLLSIAVDLQDVLDKVRETA
jgi:hypothetical protein